MATDATAAGSNRELIEVLERQIKHGGDTTVDLAAIANETDIVPVLAVEFVHYWIAMGRLHQSWREIAGKAQKNLERSGEEICDEDLQDPSHGTNRMSLYGQVLRKGSRPRCG